MFNPTYNEIHNACVHISREIEQKNVKIDKIVGIVRGGLIPATILSQQLSLPMTTVSYSSRKGQGDNKNHSNDIDIGLIEGAKSILLVDDLVDSGYTLAELYDIYTNATNLQVYTAVVHYKTCSVIRPNFYHTRVTEHGPWIVYPWESTNLL